MRKLLAMLALAALLLLGGWYIASPWLAMKGLVDDAKAGDLAGLEERIDFPRLREGLREDLFVSRDDDSRGRALFDRVGDGLARTIGGAAIDVLVTPRGMAVMVATGSVAAGALPQKLRNQELAWDVEREGLNAFRAVSSFEDGTAGPELYFERDGLGWDVVGIGLGDMR